MRIAKLTNKNNKFLIIICLVIIIIVFLFGLWPLNFHPENKVGWLKDKNGIHFYGQGIVYSSEPYNIETHDILKNNSISIEIWLQPETEPDRNIPHIISIYDNRKYEYFYVGQWKSSLIIRSRDLVLQSSEMYKEIGLNNTLLKGKMRFITITMGDEGTSFYINGKLAKVYPNYIITHKEKGLSGYLILGNSLDGKYYWTGYLFCLALYNHLLTSEQVLNNYYSWIQKGFPSNKEGLFALYLFNERSGNIVKNHSGIAPNLSIPSTFKILQKKILALSRLKLKKSFILDIVINILGFVPLGFFFSAVLSKAKHFTKYKVYLFVMFLGTGISLTIEIMQSYLPTRDSSLIDLFCNISGTILGAIFYSF
jgi:hypothetical protein